MAFRWFPSRIGSVSLHSGCIGVEQFVFVVLPRLALTVLRFRVPLCSSRARLDGLQPRQRGEVLPRRGRHEPL